MEKFTSKTVETVGQLRELLKRFPDDKPLIMDSDGNTWPPLFYNWADAENGDTEWPLAIDADVSCEEEDELIQTLLKCMRSYSSQSEVFHSCP